MCALLHKKLCGFPKLYMQGLLLKWFAWSGLQWLYKSNNMHWLQCEVLLGREMPFCLRLFKIVIPFIEIEAMRAMFPQISYCLKCTSCPECTQDVKCAECMTGAMVSADYLKCNTVCGVGYYSVDNVKCLECSRKFSNCLYCSPSGSECLSCGQGFRVVN